MDEVLAQILVVEVITEGEEHIGGADVDVAIQQIVPELDLGVTW
jgi:hypothetical protein